MLNKIEANKFLSNLTAEELLELNSLVVSKIKAMRSVKTAVAAADGEAGLNEWAKGKFGVGGKFIGQLYGNTDWALARLVWSEARAAHKSGEE